MTYEEKYWDNKSLNTKSFTDVFLPLSWLYVFGTDAIRRTFDFGCGTGKHIDTLVKVNVDAWGYDISEFARKHPFRLAKDRILPHIPNIPFDLVYSIDVFEHMRDDEIHAALEVLIRLSRLFIFVITPKGHKNYDGDSTHINPKTMDEWREFLKPYFQYIHKTPQEFFVRDTVIVCSNPIPSQK